MNARGFVSTHVWVPEDRSVSVEITLLILEQIRNRAVVGMNAFRHGGFEVGGVLFGLRGEKSARILAYAELASEHALGPAFQLSQTDLTALAGLMEAPLGLETLGWFRSHTRSRGVDLDDSDRNLFDLFFQSPGHTALILKPSAWGYTTAAFFVRSESGAIVDCPAREFTVEPLSDTARMTPERGTAGQGGLRPAERSRQAILRNDTRLRNDTAAGPAAEASPTNVDQLARAAAPPRSQRRILRYLWLLPLAASIFLLAQNWNRPSPRPLTLKAQAVSPGEVRIEWKDPGTPFPNGATGSLEIRDGALDVRIPLDAERLRLNSVVYPHLSSNLQIRMRIDLGTPRGGLLEQAIAFAAPPLPRETVLVIPEPPVQSQLPTPPLERQEPDPVPLTPPAAPEARTPPPSAQPEPAARKPLRSFRRGIIPAPSVAVPKQLPALPPPPAAAFVAARVMHPDLLPASKLPPPPAAFTPAATPVASTAAPVKYAGPRTGRLIWTGKLGKRGIVEIDGSKASIGSLTGVLPGVPISLVVAPAEFDNRGLTIYSADPRKAARTEPPNSTNGWNATEFDYHPERAREIVVLETPAAINDFKRLVLRSDARACSVLVIDWEMR